MALNVQGGSWKYHVFLSFRGEDTRANFTEHLYASLQRRGITVFRDVEEIPRGQVIPQQLLTAVEDSLFSVVVLSQNYAFSSWCLDELKKILEARNELGRQVFPIFYGVDPSDVRHQRGRFGEALAIHEERFNDRKGQLRVQQWRDALTQVAKLPGLDSRGRKEADLIEEIVEVIWDRLLPLQIGLDGLGKTTLARFVYDMYCSQEQERLQVVNSSGICSKIWRIIGFVSSVVGVATYGGSLSFKRLFGEWTLLKMFIYCALSLIVCAMTLLPRMFQAVNRFMVKPDVVFLAMMVSSLYSYLYDKFMSEKPDTLSLISSGSFALMSLSLSRQSEVGFEVGVTAFLVAFMVVQLMKINLALTSVAAIVAYIFIRLRSCSDSDSNSDTHQTLQLQHQWIINMPRLHNSQ